jgi:hypothetical protein
MPQDKVKRLSKAAACPLGDKDQGSTKPSKATLEEVQKLFKQYAKELENNAELSQTSKTMYTDFAKCFVRWMNGEFKPGCQGSNGRTRRTHMTKIWPRRPLA